MTFGLRSDYKQSFPKKYQFNGHFLETPHHSNYFGSTVCCSNMIGRRMDKDFCFWDQPTCSSPQRAIKENCNDLFSGESPVNCGPNCEIQVVRKESVFYNKTFNSTLIQLVTRSDFHLLHTVTWNYDCASE